MPTFTAKLWRWPSPKGILMLTVPVESELPIMGPFGRTPVTATVLGKSWRTSTFHTREHGTILLMPKKVVQKRGEGEAVEVRIELDLMPR